MIPHSELILVKRIASRVNPRIKMWASLADRKGRHAEGLTLAEGARLVREALDPAFNPEAVSSGDDSGFASRCLRPVTLIVSDSGAAHPDAGELFRLAGETGVERVGLADACFDKISALKNADGIALALAFDPDAAAPLRVLGNMSRILVADGVQDPGNAGALARTALAAGCDACLFIEGADPLSPKFLRGSMGAAFRLPCAHGPRGECTEALAACGARLLVATSESAPGAVSFRNADYGGKVAVVIGGEKGISPEVAALKAKRIHIPLHGNVESLNLAVAAGVVLFEAEKQWGF